MSEEPAERAELVRIGVVARLTGLTPRTLRYWEEIGLLAPSGHLGNGERLYTDGEIARLRRIRDMQETMGFSLAEIRAVLETDDLLEGIRSAYRAEDSHADRRIELLGEAAAATERLIRRLDDRLEQVQAFRDERAAMAARMRARRDELLAEPGLQTPPAPPVPSAAGAERAE